jgi:hypothetical protein
MGKKKGHVPHVSVLAFRRHARDTSSQFLNAVLMKLPEVCLFRLIDEMTWSNSRIIHFFKKISKKKKIPMDASTIAGI